MARNSRVRDTRSGKIFQELICRNLEAKGTKVQQDVRMNSFWNSYHVVDALLDDKAVLSAKYQHGKGSVDDKLLQEVISLAYDLFCSQGKLEAAILCCGGAQMKKSKKLAALQQP